MGFYKGKPFVVADNTVSIEILNNKNNQAIVFASRFPKKFKYNIFEPENCFTWNGGKLPKMYKRYNKIYTSPVELDYIFENDLYGQCYLEAYKKEGEKNYGM